MGGWPSTSVIGFPPLNQALPGTPGWQQVVCWDNRPALRTPWHQHFSSYCTKSYKNITAFPQKFHLQNPFKICKSYTNSTDVACAMFTKQCMTSSRIKIIYANNNKCGEDISNGSWIALGDEFSKERHCNNAGIAWQWHKVHIFGTQYQDWEQAMPSK